MCHASNTQCWYNWEQELITMAFSQAILHPLSRACSAKAKAFRVSILQGMVVFLEHVCQGLACTNAVRWRHGTSGASPTPKSSELWWYGFRVRGCEQTGHSWGTYIERVTFTLTLRGIPYSVTKYIHMWPSMRKGTEETLQILPWKEHSVLQPSQRQTFLGTTLDDQSRGLSSLIYTAVGLISW